MSEPVSPSRVRRARQLHDITRIKFLDQRRQFMCIGSQTNTLKSLFRFLPVPENFYDIKKTCNLISSPAVIFPYTVALYVAGVASFASFFAYYSRESSFLSETIIQAAYARNGFTCTPLQPDAHYGITFNYEECQQNMLNPSDYSVILENTGLSCGQCNAQQYNFYPFGSEHPRMQLDVSCLLYTSPSPRDLSTSRMPSSA